MANWVATRESGLIASDQMSKELMDYPGSTANPKSDLKSTPLSISQERLWVLEQLHPRNAAQNLACGLRFTDAIDRAALNSAVDEIVQRYEILRTEFQSVDGAA